MRTSVKDGRVLLWLGTPTNETCDPGPCFALEASDAEALGDDLRRQADECRRTDIKRLLRIELRSAVDAVMRKYPGCGNAYPEFFEVLQGALEDLE
jgi:hypothetical protein